MSIKIKNVTIDGIGFAADFFDNLSAQDHEFINNLPRRPDLEALVKVNEDGSFTVPIKLDVQLLDIQAEDYNDN